MPVLARRLAMALIAAAFCAAPAGQDPWIKLTSANFELYTTAGEGAGRLLIRHFEQVRSFFGQAFGESRPNAKPACIIAFGHAKEFEPYRFNEFATAFFHSAPSHDFIVMSGSSIEHDRVVVHELTHMMVHEGGRNFPPWFNEGLAELFSNLHPTGNRIMVGQDIPGHLYALEREKWLPLTTLVAVDHNSPYYNEKAKAGIFYAESWVFVRMLFLHPVYRPQLEALDAALKRGGSAADLEAAYHQSLAGIEADLRSYWRRGESNAMVFNVQLAKAAEEPKIETAAGMGARLALAEMLSVSRGKTEQAAAAYTSLAQEYPARWEVEAGWGQFFWHQRKPDEAAKHYARALELGGKDAGLFLDYGRVLHYGNRVGDAIDVLGEGARIYPDNAEIQLEIGSAYASHGNYGAALGVLGGMKKVQPAQAYRYFYDLAFAEYRLDKIAEAKAHSAKARTFAHNPGELASLDSLDRSLGIRPAPGAPPATPEPGTPRTHGAVARSSVEGMFEELECGKSARLHVRVDGKPLVFVITDPDKVVIGGNDGATVDLQCGAQKPPRAIRIEYESVAGAPDAPGVVRALQFR